MASKMTFGFKNLNGTAFSIKLLETPTGRWPSEKTIRDLRSFVIATMNKHGQNALALAKSEGWSPRKTGDLIRSITWVKAREGSTGTRVNTGALSVGVPYGRRQEFEHATRGWYLHRAIIAVFPAYLADLRNRNVLGDVIFGRRAQIGGGGVTGGRF